MQMIWTVKLSLVMCRIAGVCHCSRLHWGSIFAFHFKYSEGGGLCEDDVRSPDTMSSLMTIYGSKQNYRILCSCLSSRTWWKLLLLHQSGWGQVLATNLHFSTLSSFFGNFLKHIIDFPAFFGQMFTLSFISIYT